MIHFGQATPHKSVTRIQQVPTMLSPVSLEPRWSFDEGPPAVRLLAWSKQPRTNKALIKM